MPVKTQTDAPPETPPMARGEQLGRQWKILQILIGSRGKTVYELAQVLCCHRRTVYRDLEALQLAGFPLYTDRKEGKNCWVLLDADRRHTPLPLSLTELMALYFSRGMLKGAKDTVFAQALESLFEKIRATLPPQTVDYIDRAEETVRFSTRPFRRSSGGGTAVEQVQEAIVNRRSLDLVYYTMSRQEETRRRVDPYKIWFFDGAFYLIAYCRLRKEVRIFSMDRIRDLHTAADGFEPPEDFDADRFMEKSFGVFVGPGIAVKVRFSKKIAGYIQERLWHPRQVLTPLADGALDFEATVAGTEEVKSWVLGWGRHAQVLHPESLRREIAKEIEEIGRHYNQ
ncbi:MAG: transcriptional regulator [Desulfobacterales bacterium]|nr:transcriptional regulator [Desulfobacterales bacterium]